MVRSNSTAQEEALPPRDHNRPPSPLDLLKEQLAEVYGDDLAKIDPIAARANEAPAVINSDEDLAIWAKIGVDASKLFRHLDTARLNEKRPVVQAVDDYFADSARLSRIHTAATDKATTWNRRKAAAARAAQEAEAKRLREEAEAKRIAAEFETNEAAAVVGASAAAAMEVQAQLTEQPQKAADLTRVKTSDGVIATTSTTWDFEIVDASKVDLNAIRTFIDPKAIETAIRKIVKIQKGGTQIAGVRVFEKETATFRG